MTQRALSSGVSGMLNQQLVLDTTANNLANVNTPGFKASRVSFSTALIQSQFNGSAPGSSVGGQNPRQVGLGMTTASIDLDMRQGSIQTTGRSLDLAIQGDGFFELSDGTLSLYSRVGSFGFDANDNLVDLGSGYRVMGNTYNLLPNPDGTQSITQVGIPLVIDRSETFPPKQTESIQFQGNLSSQSDALRGFSLQSVFPLINEASGEVATEATPLRSLSMFNGATGTPGTPLTIHVFGTKPNGEAFGSSFDIHPWDPSTPQRGSVGELVESLNNSLSQGSDRFATVRLDRGNLLFSGVGSGDGFSLFIGEQNPFQTQQPVAPLSPGGGLAFTGAPVVDAATHTVTGPQAGLLNGQFTIPAYDYSGQSGAVVRVSVRINGVERGTVSITAADYSGASAAERTFGLSSFPKINAGDVISYDLSGNLDLTDGGAAPGNTLGAATTSILDSSNLNLTNDLNGNGRPDMFDENSSTDANAWQYSLATNGTFNWYRSRLVPETVTSSIQVFDAQGGKHTVTTQFFRTGTRTDALTGARINNWDMMVDIPPGSGELVADVVAGIEFDQNGRFTGGLGSTVNGTTFNESLFVGNPSSQSIEIHWASTGPTQPATIQLNFGTPNSVNGLTGFGSNSSASAVNQDGYGDGALDNLSVSAEGDIIGLYNNGVSRKLAQLQLTTFRNPGGLSQVGSNLFGESVNSGVANRRIAGQGAGFITSGALEGGNVDIATEFTRIITAQRGFQVNARVIQTTDQLLEELANLIR